MGNGPFDELYWLKVSATVSRLAVPCRKIAAHDRKNNRGDLRKSWLKKIFRVVAERKGSWEKRAVHPTPL
jgi:hypothetical protein